MTKIDVFKALADPQRRELMDRLQQEDGQTLTALCKGSLMSRQAISKHLAMLEAAGLVICVMQGRQKLHYLNPVPIKEIADRWLSKFRNHQATELIQLKRELEDRPTTGRRIK